MDDMAMATVYISLGSNIEPEKHLRASLAQLRERCDVLAVSSVYQTAPYGVTDQPDFLNMAAKIATPLFPAAFKVEVLGEIEEALGRDHSAQQDRFGPRTIDLDILLWGKTVFSYGTKPWRVPHEDILQHAAVTIPLAEIAPDFVHPEEGVPLAEIASRFDTSGIQRRDDLTIE